MRVIFKRIVIYAMISSFTFTSMVNCSAKRHLKFADETSEEKNLLAEINELGKKQTCLICTTDGRLISAKNLVVTPDSTTFDVAEQWHSEVIFYHIEWHVKNKGKHFSFPNAVIEYVGFDDRATGIGHGLIWGFISGVALGSLIAHNTGAKDQEFGGIAVAAYIAIFGVSGTALGILIGAASEAKTFFYYEGTIIEQPKH